MRLNLVTINPEPLSDTQPVTRKSKPRSAPPQKRQAPIGLVVLTWLLITLIILGLGGLLGGYSGYTSAESTRQSAALLQDAVAIQEQFTLAQQDLEAGRYDVARQRFEWVLQHQPGFPGAQEGLAQTLAILYATATPTPPPPTATPTVTPDLRPTTERLAQLDSLFTRALAQMAVSDWNGAIESLLSLRGIDLAYRAPEVDGMLYACLAQRGVDKIANHGDLEGGIYDLALAEHFGPLDNQAVVLRDYARLYLFGNSFWEAYPEQAVYYFSQVAAALPYLQDASGWTAAARYRAALLQWGDQLSSQGEACLAYEKYDLALSMGYDGFLQVTLQTAGEACFTPTPSLTPTPTGTSTPTPTGTLLWTPSATWTGFPTSTPTLTSTPSSTPPGITPSHTPTLPIPPSDTPTVGITIIPLPSDTPAPPTNTAPPPTDTPPPPSETPTPTP